MILKNHSSIHWLYTLVSFSLLVDLGKFLKILFLPSEQLACMQPNRYHTARLSNLCIKENRTLILTDGTNWSASPANMH